MLWVVEGVDVRRVEGYIGYRDNGIGGKRVKTRRCFLSSVSIKRQTNPAWHHVSVGTAMMAVQDEHRADDRQRAHEHYRREVHTCTAGT